MKSSKKAFCPWQRWTCIQLFRTSWKDAASLSHILNTCAVIYNNMLHAGALCLRTGLIEFSLLNKSFSLSLSQTLAGMSEYCSPLLEGCQTNRQHWKRLAEECEKGLVNGLV